ncbi:hypothetical protein N2152v2_011111 [Parachlorella kessleri]
MSVKEPVPSAWDPAGRAPASRYLQITGTRVKYVGPGNDDRDAASVRSNYPVPSDLPIFYYEVEVVNKGRDGFIGIGFAVRDVKLDRLPGWEPHSYGYHGDDGHAFSGRGTGRPYGPCFGTGDWIGVLWNRVEGTVSFSKRGYDLGVAFEGVHEEHLYPIVGFRTPDEEIDANFGVDLARKPFKADMAAIRKEAEQRLYSRILHLQLPASKGQSSDLVGQLVFDYLCHYGHWETAAAVGRDVLGGAVEVSQQAVEEMQKRQQVSGCVLRGDIDGAVALAREVAPGSLEAHPAVLFRLQCQKFMELINAKQDEAATAYGRTVLVPACSNEAEKELLEDALSLFAYEDPAASPCGHLLSAAARAELAAEVNKAILAMKGRREDSALECLYKQAAAAHKELVALGDPAASLVNVEDVIHTKRD